ncbi:uncharacterized protein Pyn_26608 [Prunus yedoensis var. nudiflora]|uniref:Uncharacterized protein n=1 Tax=Prunus yedoensis var. nudiflora TaxID=2094558 RepID=A0A314UL48_PRUYE|nr:uncharacterized protein Pyn_26608 [Prunus yedoensis var. nudiflora]
MTFLTLVLWRRCNAMDEDCRVWWDDHITAKFSQTVEDALQCALVKADWDPLSDKKIAAQRRPTTLIRSAPSTPPPTCSVPSPPLTSPPRVPAVDQPPTPSAAPDAEGMTFELPPIDPSIEIVTEGMPREEATTVIEEGEAAKAEVEASVVVGAMVEDGEAIGAAVVPELRASRPAKRLHITLSSSEDEGEDEAPPTELVDVAASKAAVAAMPSPADLPLVLVSMVAAVSLPVEMVVPTLVTSITPHRPSGIVIRSEPTSSDNLDALFTSLYEEGAQLALDHSAKRQF